MTISTTNNADITREMLDLLSPNAVRKLARDRFGMTMPFSFKKDDLVSAVLDQVAPSDDDSEPDDLDPELTEILNAKHETSTLADTLNQSYIGTAEETAQASSVDPQNLADFQEKMLPIVASIKPVTVEPSDEERADSGKRTREEVANRLAAHRERLAREAAEREAAAEATKKSKERWQPTSDELNKRASKLAFAIGSLVSAHARIAKESAILSSVLSAMGELASGDVLELAKQSMIEGYSYAQQRTCFPSDALSSTLSGDALRDAVWTELVAVGIPVLINETPDSE